MQGRGVPNYLGAAASRLTARRRGCLRSRTTCCAARCATAPALNFQSTVRAVSSRVDLALAARGSGRPHRSRQRESGHCCGVRPARGLPVRGARDKPRGRRCVDAHRKFRVVPHRRRAGAAGPRRSPPTARRWWSTTSWTARSASTTCSALLARRQVEQSAVRIATERTDWQRAARGAMSCLASSCSTTHAIPRLARDRYMSCASCHNDGGHDGRIWDLTGFGEGLRNTVEPAWTRRHRVIDSHGGLHWTNNFDELQDFEGQIRALAGGTGLMTDATFSTGTRCPATRRSQGRPLGRPRCARRVRRHRLRPLRLSPFRPGSNATDRSGSRRARRVRDRNCCGTCHAGTQVQRQRRPDAVRTSARSSPSSGSRLCGALTGTGRRRPCAMCGRRRPICTTAPRRR